VHLYVATMTAAHPIGGTIIPYEYANALARRGHRVAVGHASLPPHVRSVDDIPWFAFDERVAHYFALGGNGAAGPVGDVVIGDVGLPRELGLPAILMQGYLAGPTDEVHVIPDRWRPNGPVFCESKFLADQSLRFGLPPHRVVHVPNGLRHDLFSVRTPPEERGPVVGMLYADEPVKGGRLGLEVLHEAHRRVPELRAILFAAQAPPPDGLPEWVDFRRKVPQAALGDLYNECRVFLCTVVREGFGNTGLEALACGCALVTTDTGGSRDFAVAGETALVSFTHDRQELVDHLVSALSDDARRAELVAQGRQMASGFDWDANAEVMESTLVDYLERPHRYFDGWPARTLAYLGDDPTLEPARAWQEDPPPSPVRRQATVGLRTVSVETFGDPLSVALTDVVLSGATYPHPGWLPEVEAILDVGAGVGAATLPFARRHPRAVVHAIEASPAAHALLVENTAGEANVVCHHAALVPGHQSALLFTPPGSPLLASLVPPPSVGNTQERVQGLSADWWFGGMHRPVGIVKVHTNGAEAQIVEAMAAWLPAVAVVHVEYTGFDQLPRVDEVLLPSHRCLFGDIRPERGSVLYLRRDLQPNPYTRQHALPEFRSLRSVEASSPGAATSEREGDTGPWS
jgi:FkbM family methyltransferase